MKRTITIMLTAAMLISLTACAADGSNPTQSKTTAAGNSDSTGSTENADKTTDTSTDNTDDNEPIENASVDISDFSDDIAAIDLPFIYAVDGNVRMRWENKLARQYDSVQLLRGESKDGLYSVLGTFSKDDKDSIFYYVDFGAADKNYFYALRGQKDGQYSAATIKQASVKPEKWYKNEEKYIYLDLVGGNYEGHTFFKENGETCGYVELVDYKSENNVEFTYNGKDGETTLTFTKCLSRKDVNGNDTYFYVLIEEARVIVVGVDGEGIVTEQIFYPCE